ncbi:MAG: tetratricopeptide repeat protein [Acidobacteriaceae bacterium]
MALYPFDAIEWIELARGFTTLGNLNKAHRCVTAALTLAPLDVFVLRAASRFHIQQSDPDRAQWILTRCPRTLSNPWLLASEIAAASVANRESQLISVGRRVEQADFSAEDLTELRAALATADVDAGSQARGKKLLRRSLAGANENSLAQVQWVDRTRLGNIIDLSEARPPQRYEAAAWRAYFEGDWIKASKCARMWFFDQPFSMNAGIFCSFVLSDLAGRPDESLDILNVALRANPDNHTLKNNLAFTYIKLGRLKESEEVLRSIPILQENIEDAAVEATLGLLHFRNGLMEQGRTSYERAIQTFLRDGATDHAARAALHLALEEVNARTAEAAASAARALRLAKDIERPDITAKINDLNAGVKAWLAEPR